MAAFVTIAQISRTRGIRGEVAARSLTDFPERFEAVSKVRIETPKATYWETLESFRFHKNQVLLKFEGKNRPHEVEHLVGGEVQIPEEERVELPSDMYFQSDLVGCEVLNRGASLGQVRGLLETGAADLLLVEAGSDEILLPLLKQYLLKVDVNAKKIEVDVPTELVELNRGDTSSKGRKRKHGPGSTSEGSRPDRKW